MDTSLNCSRKTMWNHSMRGVYQKYRHNTAFPQLAAYGKLRLVDGVFRGDSIHEGVRYIFFLQNNRIRELLDDLRNNCKDRWKCGALLTMPKVQSSDDHSWYSTFCLEFVGNVVCWTEWEGQQFRILQALVPLSWTWWIITIFGYVRPTMAWSLCSYTPHCDLWDCAEIY